jgi:pentatricopeptide repeat protein
MCIIMRCGWKEVHRSDLIAGTLPPPPTHPPITADPAPNEKVYNSLIEACCLDADTLDRSWRALRNMKKAGTSPCPMHWE